MPQATPPTATSRAGLKHQRRRADILRAALLAFRDEGYYRTTLDDIAGRLGVRKTALYYYFPDKEGILYECHQRSLARMMAIVEHAQQHRTADDRLRYAIGEHVRVMTDTLEGSPSAFDVSALTPAHQREIVDGRDRYERSLRNLVQQGIDEGAFRRVDPKIAVFVILGAINSIARWYRPQGSRHARTLGIEFADHLVRGLTCR